MKSVLLSIKPKYCDLIANGKKTVEVRKTKPKIETPFKCYIYETKDKTEIPTFIDEEGHAIYEGRGQVIGEFVCDTIYHFVQAGAGTMFADEKLNLFTPQEARKTTCLNDKDVDGYLDGKDGYGWHISDIKIYDKPKDITDFKKPCIMPEQPYCPCCEVGGEYISETEAEFYRVDGECFTEWICLNYLKRPPQSWCYVEELV